MFKENEFSIFDIVSGISEAVDLVSPELNDHHKKVAYISYNIATEMDLPGDEVRDIVLGAILHDIGAFTTEERLEVMAARFADSEYSQHPTMGYKLLRGFEPLLKAAELINYHHVHFSKLTEKIPMGSFIIHLADRLSLIRDEGREILEQIPEIMAAINSHRNVFHPEPLAALDRLSKMEYFWIETSTIPPTEVLSDRMMFSKKSLDLEALRCLAKVISQIIDFRSRFTSTHSSGVAAVARELTTISGFSDRECKLMEIAGYLHDLGKLAIPSDIIEKHGALDHEEFNEMRKHSYYTYTVLSKVEGFEQIAMWAAYHHERLDGNGYPFHIKGEDFSKLARIMSVADIVTAITEDRPYRLGMDSEKAMEVLFGMAENGGIDKSTVEIVKDNFYLINDVRIQAQHEALQEYKAFYEF